MNSIKTSANHTENNGEIPGFDFQNLFDNLPCYITIQNSNFHILFANQTFKNDFGDVTGKLCHIAYKRSPQICSACPAQKTFDDGQIHTSEETIQTPNGKIHHVIIQSAPIFDTAGDVAAVTKMSFNITEIKESQKELTTLGAAVAILSHGIKNILEGLQGGAYVVNEGFREGDLELAEKGWDVVLRNITDITDVVQNILYTSKSRPLKYQKVSPCEIVEESVKTFKERAKAMDIEIRHEVNADLPRVSLDSLSIRRMLNNFIWNAMEACLKDEKKVPHFVIVRTDFYYNSQFMFEVEDNGIGMDETTKASIFQEFYSTKGSGGTGLGLSVVDTIVNRHGGRKEVDTASGKGSTFRVILDIG